ncbi:hypothetical protein RGQ15_03210 [Paracoccus sp. MBLB3053]|uniref:Uncharacterized protein n=1 Tax=Paracoccus aurantius TaxID=3073814 RepID=A0ABU2HNH1_9RHOB|nr:hypothetical protein [Paracoccus sp. MBLB3053]MDS9466587.1 hypothetical protein [Paracoccus sp. MBLB3053]
MMIRVAMRAMPLLLVAFFALSVLVLDGADDRSREMARVNAHRLAWAEHQVKCPEAWENLPISACTLGNAPINPSPAH